MREDPRHIIFLPCLKSNHQHSAVYRMNESSAVDKIVPKKIRPHSVAARRRNKRYSVSWLDKSWNGMQLTMRNSRVMLKTVATR